MNRVLIGMLVFLAIGVSFVSAPVAETDGPIFLGDYDGYGILDEFDNCIEAWNGLPDAPVAGPPGDSCAPQQDNDNDGYGNACNTDINNDGATGMDDLGAVFGELTQHVENSAADFNCDGATGLDDLLVVLNTMGNLSGPSGLSCAGSFPCLPVVSW